MYTYAFFFRNYSTIHSYQCQHFYFLFFYFLRQGHFGLVNFVLYITISILKLFWSEYFSLRSTVRTAVRCLQSEVKWQNSDSSLHIKCTPEIHNRHFLINVLFLIILLFFYFFNIFNMQFNIFCFW